MRTPRAAGAAIMVVAIIAGVIATLSTGGSHSAAPQRPSAPAGVASPSGGKSDSTASATTSPIIRQAVHHDVSPPLRTLKSALGRLGPVAPRDEGDDEMPKPPRSNTADPVVQRQLGSGQIPGTSVNFEGLAAGQAGGAYVPPDANGAAGPSNYFEIVNAEIAVYTKSGSKVYGPVSTNTIWSGFGGNCQNFDDGDGTVVYDQLSGRWIVQQFYVEATPYLECVAVSTSGDPTGTYNRYSFSFGTDFPDYPKLGVWPDAYYITYNVFGNSGNSWSGPEVCALDRAKMIAGQGGVTQQCFHPGTSYSSLLPASVDGSTPPPSGSPNFEVAFGTNSLQLWKFQVDWANSANSTFTGPTVLPVAAFSQACGGGACIPQPGTTAKLDSLGDRLMYRLGYRNFGDHESLVVAHSVTANGVAGMRWYELRSPNATPKVYQQGTYAPDGTYRWMGSVAMDHVGDMALGFGVSSSSVYPGARYTGRLVNDALGTMGQGESTLVSGVGVQVGSYTRWGDYTSMAVDPADDCTFWYLGEYQPAGKDEFNWKTRIGAFTFPSCTSSGGSAPVVSSFLPASGPVATNVAVTGTGFTGATAVQFNGTASTSVTVDSDTSIHATVPVGASTGPISVTTPNGTGQSTTSFTVTTSGGNPPTVTSFTPTNGPVGTNVQVFGTNFTNATAVTFNNTPASTFTIDSGTSIHATVPVGATTGRIAVTNPDGSGQSSTSFTVTTTSGKPTITSFTPTSGKRGSKVTINGANLAGVTAVRLGSATSAFTYNAVTQSISATVPSNVFSFGSYKWTVTGPGGGATSAAYFRVTG